MYTKVKFITTNKRGKYADDNIYNHNNNYHCLTCHPESHGMEIGRVFFFHWCSVVLLTFKQSKNPSTISQYFAVPSASGSPNDLSTQPLKHSTLEQPG